MSSGPTNPPTMWPMSGPPVAPSVVIPLPTAPIPAAIASQGALPSPKTAEQIQAQINQLEEQISALKAQLAKMQ